jgi:hypothetical protein
MIPRLTFLAAGLSLAAFAIDASAQTPKPPPANAAAITAPPPIPASPGDSPNVLPEVESILRHRPWHEQYARQPAGFRNPGDAGRTNSYYPADNQFQNPGHARAGATYLGGIPDRNEQLAAYNAGTARYSAIQNHIDSYGRPSFGFGMGFGFR